MLLVKKRFYSLQERCANFDLQIESTGVTSSLPPLTKALKFYLLSIPHPLRKRDKQLPGIAQFVIKVSDLTTTGSLLRSNLDNIIQISSAFR